MNNALFSSSRDDWETPPDFFAALNEEFHFTLDVCALPETAKCADYFTPEDDGLSRPWIAPGGGAVFCNPPYSRRTKNSPGQEAWIKKAAEEGQRPGAVVVMLPGVDLPGALLYALTPAIPGGPWLLLFFLFALVPFNGEVCA